MAKQIYLTHGMSHTKVYRTWQGMKGRCYNKAHARFQDWGGRGITVCSEWQDNFPKFFEDMGHPPKGMSLDRKNNDLGYSKSNCRWATAQEQSDNKRRKVTSKRVHQLCLSTGEVINTFDTIMQAERRTGVTNPNIVKVCRGARPNAGGFRWEYVA